MPSNEPAPAKPAADPKPTGWASQTGVVGAPDADYAPEKP